VEGRDSRPAAGEIEAGIVATSCDDEKTYLCVCVYSAFTSVRVMQNGTLTPSVLAKDATTVVADALQGSSRPTDLTVGHRVISR
jgi:hypothetical protein